MARRTQGKNSNLYVIGLIIVIIVAVVFFSGWMRRRSVSVRAEKVTRENISSVISTNGKIEPITSFEAHAPAPASVARVFVAEGDPVKQGQLILQLDDAEAHAQAAKALALLRGAEADLHAIQSGGTQEEVLTTRSDLTKAQAEQNQARRNLDAIQRLAQTGAASPGEVQAAQDRVKKADADVQLLTSKQTERFSSADIEKAQANVDQARAAYSAAQDLLKNTHVRAPFAGTVYQLPVRQGTYVNSGELLVQVADLSRVHVRAFVDEPEIGRLAQGQKVLVRWDAVPGRVWEGQITRVPSVVTMVGTRTVGEVTCEIQNTDRKLLPNVNVNVSVVTARHDNALTVAREAVHEQDGKRWVYQIADDRLTMKEVQTGIASLTRVEILKGLPDGSQVALGAMNSQPLRNGMEVKVAER